MGFRSFFKLAECYSATTTPNAPHAQSRKERRSRARNSAADEASQRPLRGWRHMYATQAPCAPYMQPAGGYYLSPLHAGPPARGPPPPSEAEVCSLLDGADHTFIVFNGHGAQSACCGLIQNDVQPLSPVHLLPRPPGWTAEGNAPLVLDTSEEARASANGGVYPHPRPCPQDSPLGKLALNAFLLCAEKLPSHFVGRVDGAAWNALLGAVNAVATTPRGSDHRTNVASVSAQLARVVLQHAAALGPQVDLTVQELPFQTWFRGWQGGPPPSVSASAEWVEASILVIRVQLRRSGAPPPPRELQLPNAPGAHPVLRSQAFRKIWTRYGGMNSIAYAHNRRCVNIP